jgi:ribonuclease J
LNILGKRQVTLKLIPDVDGRPKVAQLVCFSMVGIAVKGSWIGPGRLHLVPHVNARVADLPVHRVIEARHMVAHARLAESVGVPKDHIFVMENGQCLELTAGSAAISEHVDSGVVYVDGLSVGDVGTVVLRDRQQLAQDGIAMIVVTIDGQNGRVIGEAELVTRGIVFGAGSDGLLDDAKARLAKTLAKTSGEGATDQRVIKNALRESLSKFMWENLRRRPMVIPIVMEV